MRELPQKLKEKLQKRREENALRMLRSNEGLIDFASNDYLGFASSDDLFLDVEKFMRQKEIVRNGSTGSRMLTGNHSLYQIAEELIAEHHRCPAALIFNSGYDANLGFFSSVPQKNDLILYDELVHASIRDGINMSAARAYKFKHNNLEDLLVLLTRQREKTGAVNGSVYIVTESVFSMDGDTPDIEGLIRLCKNEKCLLVVDEAHAFGIFGDKGGGLMDVPQWDKQWFARIVTFGKALGAHGAAVLCDEVLKEYLLNFARSFIYTTALPPHALASVIVGYNRLDGKAGRNARITLLSRLTYFVEKMEEFGLSEHFVKSSSAIQSCIIPGNKRVKEISDILRQSGYDVRPILSPTVAKGMERLRFCLHSFNSEAEIEGSLAILAKNMKAE